MSERINHFHKILARHQGNNCHAQRERIITAIQELGSVTTFEAIRYLDCYDPRPRVWELRHLIGHKIITHMRAEQTESGVLHRIGVYMMAARETAK
jgi:hypothetical protein